ncbi:Ferrochelatase [Gracilariopsis chorda]|uniref:Ferrochelatase n=1 Tax=Gracilariopsis chorda TaxID=448386 RepID=A0A2V3IE83_9FLOR|nr:Ferrochelatase [Gracilariopsis chorda]|eukprot:PXF40395.1 Ferrochelatase [Gracilariopsis chorda]
MAFVTPTPFTSRRVQTHRNVSSRRPVFATAVEPNAPAAPGLQRQAELGKEVSPPFIGRTGILLVNIGTPASLAVSDVREYLRQFLGDSRVVDLNPIVKWFVLNLFILPSRPKESAEAYSSIWDEERGSPLLYHSQDFAEKLQSLLGEKYDVAVGMQYCEPNVYTVMEDLRARGVDRLIVVPMYPQYASSATGAAIEIVYKAAAKVYTTPYLHIVPAFYDHPAYISSFSSIIKRKIGERCENYDHLLMSFHGVPQTHCERTDETGLLCNKQQNCCAQIVQANRNCYRAQSFATARRIAEELEIPEGKYSIAFQSRLSAAGPVWIQPYTDEELVRLAKAGVKRIAVVVPSFTADCLETLEEIGIRGKEDFIEAGGEALDLIPCLNSDEQWAKGMIQILKDSCPMDTF